VAALADKQAEVDQVLFAVIHRAAITNIFVPSCLPCGNLTAGETVEASYSGGS
jgi:hypothetical protein